jgi:hypothetical protein
VAKPGMQKIILKFLDLKPAIMIKSLRWPIICLLFAISISVKSQSATQIDSIQFFLEERPMEATLSTDLKIIVGEKPEGKNYIPATFTTKFPDSTLVSEQIRITTRGAVRRQICYMPPLRLNFHNTTSPRLYPLHNLKLVVGCKTNVDYEQYVLKEFLCYKIYNQLTDKSFRVRLVHINYQDSKGKKKPFSQYGFFVENIDEMARRNHLKELKGTRTNQESTDRKHMTLVSIFEYMIANTDWSVPVEHNIKLLHDKKDSNSIPFAVAYDFDYAGLVNTDYAIAEPKLEIESVTTRLYRGFPRTEIELAEAFKVFNEKKEAIYSLIKNFEPLSSRNKKDMVSYLEDFYKIINDKTYAKDVFIQNARRE